VATLTTEERNYIISLLKHPALFKLFDELEQSNFSDALFAKPHEHDKINSALGENRAIQSLRQKLQLTEAAKAAS
jgi:hypothetical protein